MYTAGGGIPMHTDGARKCSRPGPGSTSHTPLPPRQPARAKPPAAAHGAPGTAAGPTGQGKAAAGSERRQGRAGRGRSGQREKVRAGSEKRQEPRRGRGGSAGAALSRGRGGAPALTVHRPGLRTDPAAGPRQTGSAAGALPVPACPWETAASRPPAAFRIWLVKD